MQQRVESIETPDGPFDLTVWVPDSGTGPGILLIQEIYGVGEYIRAVAADLARLGYVVGAPDLFWRLAPGYSALHDADGLTRSLELSSRFDLPAGLGDTVAALRHLAAQPEVAGGTGMLGFCFGGSIAYLAAAQSAPDVVVSFYGSMVPDHLDLLGRIRCPLLFHFGGSDQYIPRERVKAVEEAVAGRPNVVIYVEEEAGHAFHNRVAPMFYQPEPASRAWQRTEEFLHRHLPTQ